MRKKFPCGHKGLGCHRCAQAERLERIASGEEELSPKYEGWGKDEFDFEINRLREVM